MIQVQIFREDDPDNMTWKMNDLLKRTNVFPLEIRINDDAKSGLIIYQDSPLVPPTPPPQSTVGSPWRPN